MKEIINALKNELKIGREPKIKMFTHTDLDGAGCAILGKIAYRDNLAVECCNYDEINNEILKHNLLDFDLIFLTDISVNEKTAEYLERHNKSKNCKVVLLDHHKTALWLNKYDWATVEEYQADSNTKQAGAIMFYNWLLDNYINLFEIGEGIDNQVLFKFAETVRRYDTWEWKTKFDNNIPKKWNDLLYICGRDRFIEDMVKRLKNADFEFNSTDKLLLELEEEKTKKYIEKKTISLMKKDIVGYKAGVVFAEQYISELGDKLMQFYPELDFVAIINANCSISYRTNKDDVDLSKIAEFFGGGGHPKASGSGIDEEDKEKFIDDLFSFEDKLSNKFKFKHIINGKEGIAVKIEGDLYSLNFVSNDKIDNSDVYSNGFIRNIIEGKWEVENFEKESKCLKK